MSERYRICVPGRLGRELLHLLSDLTPEQGETSTILYTEDCDQPSLHGTLDRLGNLGLTIELVEKVDEGPDLGTRASSSGQP